MTTAFSPEYKVVLAPPTDTDPPSNPIYTVDNVIGINPPFINTHQLPDPYDFEAVGDGVADDTLAYQAWLDAIANGAGYGAPGTFGISSTVKISGNTTIYGAGKGAHTLRKLAGYPASQQLLTNKNIQVSPPQVDASIQIFGICMQGISGDITSVELVAMVGVLGLTFRDCLFEHSRGFLLACSNSIGVNIETNEFYDWGKLAASGEGGEAIFVPASSQDVSITNNYIHNGEWGGIYIAANRFVVSGNRILFVKESGINGGGIGGSITGNRISGVVTKISLGNGIALFEPQGVTITGNVVDVCDESNLFLVDPVLVTATGNTFNVAGQNQTNFPDAAAVQVDAVTAQGCVDTTISNNTISDATGNCAYGIRLSNFGFPTAPPYVSFQCNNNNLSNSLWRVQALLIDANVAGQSATDVAPNDEFMCRGNLGTPNEDRSAVSFTVPSGSSGTMLINGVGFKPRSIDFQAGINSTSKQSNSIGQSMWQTLWGPGAPGSVLVPRANFKSNTFTWSSDGTVSACGGTFAEDCVALYEPDGVTPICVARVSGVVDDGFILLFSAPTTTDAFITAVCFP
jgi:hypothetical protein